MKKSTSFLTSGVPTTMLLFPIFCFEKSIQDYITEEQKDYNFNIENNKVLISLIRHNEIYIYVERLID